MREEGREEERRREGVRQENVPPGEDETQALVRRRHKLRLP